MVLCLGLIQSTRGWIYLLLFVETLHSSTFQPKIDEQYEKAYPDCGKKTPRIRKRGGSRISNSVLSEDRYPWVITVIRTYKSAGMPQGDEKEMMCAGTIISDK